MTRFGRERRTACRVGNPGTEVVFVVRDGREPDRTSAPVSASLRDLSHTGMSLFSPRLAPDGIHIMYDTLMTVRNQVEAEVRPRGGQSFKVSGFVIWFRADDARPGHYIFGMTFDVPLPAGPLPVA